MRRKREISEADIILCLLSQDFLSTDYVVDFEIPFACKKYEQGTIRIIPIILHPCTWEDDFPIMIKHLVLPDKSKPLSKWENQEEAWVAIINGIRKVIQP